MDTHPIAGDGVYEITPADTATLILKEFVTQPSTTIYRRSIAPAIKFNLTQKNAGEDMLFFLTLVEKVRRVCFSGEIRVDCGQGINMFWNNLDWGKRRPFAPDYRYVSITSLYQKKFISQRG